MRRARWLFHMPIKECHPREGRRLKPLPHTGQFVNLAATARMLLPFWIGPAVAYIDVAQPLQRDGLIGSCFRHRLDIFIGRLRGLQLDPRPVREHTDASVQLSRKRVTAEETVPPYGEEDTGKEKQ